MKNTKTLTASITATALILGVTVLAAIFLNHGQETKVVRALCSLKYPDQISQAKQFCTPKGFDIMQAIVAEDGSFGLSTYRFSGVKSNPGLVDVEMNRNTAEGNSRIFVRLINSDGWKVDDFYVAERNDKKVNLWFSYIEDHPIASFLEVNADDICKTTEDILKFCKEIKDLSDDHKQTEAMTVADNQW
jgi:hypothetical protein